MEDPILVNVDVDIEEEEDDSKDELSKPFPCPHPGCGKRFSKSSNLAQHLRIHSGEKPFMCNICGRTFRQSGNLTKHTKSHQNAHLRWNRNTSEKPYKCSHAGCDKSFTAKSSLQIHINTAHLGSRPSSKKSEENPNPKPSKPPRSETSKSKNNGATESKKSSKKDADSASAKSSSSTASKTAMEPPKILHCGHPQCTKTFTSEAELRAHIMTAAPGMAAENRVLRESVAKLLSFVDQWGRAHPEFTSEATGLVDLNEIRSLMRSTYTDAAPAATVANSKALFSSMVSGAYPCAAAEAAKKAPKKKLRGAGKEHAAAAAAAAALAGDSPRSKPSAIDLRLPLGNMQQIQQAQQLQQMQQFQQMQQQYQFMRSARGSGKDKDGQLRTARSDNGEYPFDLETLDYDPFNVDLGIITPRLETAAGFLDGTAFDGTPRFSPRFPSPRGGGVPDIDPAAWGAMPPGGMPMMPGMPMGYRGPMVGAMPGMAYAQYAAAMNMGYGAMPPPSSAGNNSGETAGASAASGSEDGSQGGRKRDRDGGSEASDEAATTEQRPKRRYAGKSPR